MMTCNHKHADYNVPMENWQCPDCGACEAWSIDESPNYGCLLMHDEDILRCYACGCTMSGREFSEDAIRRLNLVRCDKCGGTGWCPGG